MALIDKLTAIADAIRAKTGGTETLTLDQMATEVAGIEVGGGASDVMDKVVNRGFTEVSGDYTSIGSYAFAYCHQLQKAHFPLATSLSDGVFKNCVVLTDVNAPLVTEVQDYAFQYCTSLKKLDLHNTTSIANMAFHGASGLTTIVLRSETLCSLSSVNAFANTPFAEGGTGGTIYVPEALIESYQTATNWSSLYAAGTCNFVAIEGSEYE